MTPKFDFFNRSTRQSPDSPEGNAHKIKESPGAMDMLKRDRFELLSAYLDGEVTASERRQVEDWLANDTAVQKLYSRLLQLRQGLRTLPVPQPEEPTEARVQKVLARVKRRSKLAVVWGGGAVAALLVGAVSTMIPGGQSPLHQLAQQTVKPETAAAPADNMMVAVALNNPVIEIPKAAIANPENADQQQVHKTNKLD